VAGETPRADAPADRAGWLIAKADLIELTGDDRAVILGLLVEAAATLRGEAREQQLPLWRSRGRRAFLAESDEAV